MDFFQSFPPPLVSVTTNLHETIQDQTWAIRDNPQRCICPPSCSVHPVPGLGSSKRLIGSESTVSYVAASAASAVVARHSYICRMPLQMNNNICHNQNHVLYSLLPPPSTASQNYDLRLPAHSQQLPKHTGHPGLDWPLCHGTGAPMAPYW